MKRHSLFNIALTSLLAVGLIATPVLAALPCEVFMGSATVQSEQAHACCKDKPQAGHQKSQSDSCERHCEMQQKESSAAIVPADTASYGHKQVFAYMVALKPEPDYFIYQHSLVTELPKHPQAPPGKVYLFHRNLRL